MASTQIRMLQETKTEEGVPGFRRAGRGAGIAHGLGVVVRPLDVLAASLPAAPVPFGLLVVPSSMIHKVRSAPMHPPRPSGRFHVPMQENSGKSRHASSVEHHRDPQAFIGHAVDRRWAGTGGHSLFRRGRMALPNAGRSHFLGYSARYESTACSSTGL